MGSRSAHVNSHTTRFRPSQRCHRCPRSSHRSGDGEGCRILDVGCADRGRAGGPPSVCNCRRCFCFLCCSSLLLLLLAIAGELRPLPAGDTDSAFSSRMARSNASTRSSSGEAAFSLSFLDFFFLGSCQHSQQANAPKHLLLHNTSILDSSLELEGAAWAEVIVRGHGPLYVVVVQVMEKCRHASRPPSADQ